MRIIFAYCLCLVGELQRWRTFSAHDLKWIDPISHQSLARRVCELDGSLPMSLGGGGGVGLPAERPGEDSAQNPYEVFVLVPYRKTEKGRGRRGVSSQNGNPICEGYVQIMDFSCKKSELINGHYCHLFRRVCPTRSNKLSW